ncbi:MAG: hypothetical protein KGH64_00645 [Candidatus Micrarchaeota archaeon]|nr:hypothetical protein [Candidatus Micrarchaeota archaeon]
MKKMARMCHLVPGLQDNRLYKSIKVAIEAIDHETKHSTEQELIEERKQARKQELNDDVKRLEVLVDATRNCKKYGWDNPEPKQLRQLAFLETLLAEKIARRDK